MLTTIATLTGIFVLAALAEALVEYLLKPVVDDIAGDVKATWRDLTLRYTAALAGILLCVLYRADLLTYFDLVPPWPWIGYVITGLIVGRGSNFVHDFASRWLASD